MNRPRKAFMVYLDLDPLPGLMHTPEEALRHLSEILQNFFRPYKPMVTLAPMKAQLPPSVEARTRKAYVVYLDMDPVPGVMHVPDNARFMLQRVLNVALSSYAPEIYHAPEEFQPKEGN